ncbi:MAG: SpoIIE family protein phosphatase [Planctomycetota bacterium]|nr:MAG: SpoIIE family protein phosphatase [Planctomycetota bacterium]
MTTASRRTLLARFRKARLRTQLLLAVNLSIAAVLAGFVVADYRHTVSTKLQDKQNALADEARTIETAVRTLRAGGWEAIQDFIDTTCATMNVRESPGHTIEVTLGGTTLVADPATHGHDHASAWSDLVWGESGNAGLGVRVGERRGPVLADVRRAELGRIGAILVAGAVGAAVLNVLLIRLVTRPVERMADAVRDIGHGRLGTTVEINANRELSDLAGAVSSMSLELARRDADRRAQLDRARRLQAHLVPASGADSTMSVAIEYHPADAVAGDLVDVITCANGDTLLCVADVVGHGIHAAMGSSILKALLLAANQDGASPAQMLHAINRGFCRSSLPEDFATMVIVRLARESGGASYASAGHEIGYVRRAGGGCDPMGSTGVILGIEEGASFEDVTIHLGPGDLLVLLSDGVTETFGEDGSLLGRQRIAALIQDAPRPDASEIATAIVDAARRHRGEAPALDDVTVLVAAMAALSTERSALRCDTLSGT